jgi:multicomponent Na+:H+ antiporter subunit C
MTLLFSLVIAILFGAGAYLMLTRDLYRVIAGILLLSNATNLFLMASGHHIGAVPILPLSEHTADVSDPLVQALTLTALVITFAVTAVLGSLLVRVHDSHGSIDMQDMAEIENREEKRRERRAGMD